MDSTDLRALFRAEVRDEAAPYLWSDTEIWSYINEAQNMFCRMQGGIADSSSPITQLLAPAGQPFVPLDPRILKLRAVTRPDTGAFINILNFEDLQQGFIADDYGYRTVGYGRLTNRVGPIHAVISGMEVNMLRMLDIPDTDTPLAMIVYRLPLIPITGQDQVLEIDMQHHRSLLMWMKYLALQKQDAESFDRGKASDYQMQFMAYCDQARQERERREHKYRAIAYGGY